MNFRLTTKNKTTTLIKEMNYTLSRVTLWPETFWSETVCLASVTMAGDTLACNILASDTLASFFASFGGPKGEKKNSKERIQGKNLKKIVTWKKGIFFKFFPMVPLWKFASFGTPKEARKMAKVSLAKGSFSGQHVPAKVSLAKVSFWPKCKSANKRMEKKIDFLTCSCMIYNPIIFFRLKFFDLSLFKCKSPHKLF